MEIGVIGCGYVGLTVAACLAEVGNEVLCADRNARIIRELNRREVPFFEPGLAELLRKNLKAGRLHFTQDVRQVSQEKRVIFIAVGTPPGRDGTSDLSGLFAAIVEIASGSESGRGSRLLVIKSTVPPGTAEEVEKRLRRRCPGKRWDIVSNPEFLREGSAIADFMSPNRIVLGVSNQRPLAVLRKVYAPFVRRLEKERLLVMGRRSAELAKYAANSMLALRVSFINEIADLCEKTGARVNDVRRVLGTDPRIGPTYLYPGLGFGGSCLVKDLKTIIAVGDGKPPLPTLRAALKSNAERGNWMVERIRQFFGGEKGLRHKVIAVWGLSYKPKTDDLRAAPVLPVIQKLVSSHVRVKVHDPASLPKARSILGSRVNFHEDHYDCLKGADALLIATEWLLYRSPDFQRMKRLMKRPVIFDGRNLYDSHMMARVGFTYLDAGNSGGS